MDDHNRRLSGKRLRGTWSMHFESPDLPFESERTHLFKKICIGALLVNKLCVIANGVAITFALKEMVIQPSPFSFLSLSTESIPQSS